MDWYSWLSRTNLDQAWVYEYSLLFSRSDIQENDINTFDHAFLQRMGIFIAKHRLEILKLSGKEVKGRMSGFSRLVLVMKKTKKLFGKWSHFSKEGRQTSTKTLFSTRKCRSWSESIIGKDNNNNTDMYPNRTPLVGYISRSQTVPRNAEKWGFRTKVKCCGDADRAQPVPVWSLMFRDIKPN